MINDLRTTFSHNNLKILRPKVTKNLTNLLKKFCEFRPLSLILVKTTNIQTENNEGRLYICKQQSLQKILHYLIQACTTYGPRAKCGPRKLLIWPAILQILFILPLSLIKTPFECVKTYKIWPLDMSKKIFWHAVRFELCTPDLIECELFPKDDVFEVKNCY
jgi:hypothetical protein